MTEIINSFHQHSFLRLQWPGNTSTIVFTIHLHNNGRTGRAAPTKTGWPKDYLCFQTSDHCDSCWPQAAGSRNSSERPLSPSTPWGLRQTEDTVQPSFWLSGFWISLISPQFYRLILVIFDLTFLLSYECDWAVQLFFSFLLFLCGKRYQKMENKDDLLKLFGLITIIWIEKKSLVSRNVI